MEKQFGVTGAIVECRDCGWRSESYKNAQTNAARHAKAHKHKVSVEVTMAGYYDGKN